jgi:hypothetical protein
MTNRLTTTALSAATAIMLLTACGEDGPTTLALGEDIELVGEDGLAGQTLDVRAEEEDGQATGELRFSDSSGEVVVRVECSDTDTDDLVILGGTVTNEGAEVTGPHALFIRSGEPDTVALWADDDARTCTELLASGRAAVLTDEDAFVEVESRTGIETR